MRRFDPSCIGMILGVLCLGSGGVAEEGGVDFARDVRTILAGKCYTCHGLDEKARKADLRLDLRELATRPLKSGRVAIVPGDVNKSELVRRVLSDDADLQMPPPEVKKPLTEAEKQVLRAWVEQGADYQLHWSFTAPTRPALPPVRDTQWPVNEVDRFILASLEQAKLRPTPEADRYTLIRRLYLDLLGLPPTPQEVDAFVSDPSADAWPRLVDRVLNSPRFGEKLGLMWLDLARFGDTNGYHYDSTREMWLWRDYVIQAYNRDKPFDRFTIEQLAGDLLAQPTTEHLVASGFNRNTRFNEEGGADPEEFAITYAKDRVFTLGQVWLGLTTGCAECHSHKYDPLTHTEYYQLFAFFNSIQEPQVSGNHGQKLEPLLKVPSEEQAAQVADTKAKLTEVERQIERLLSEVKYLEPPFLPVSRPNLEKPADHVWIDDELPGVATPEGDPFEWVELPVQSGKRAMKRAAILGNQHFFTVGSRKLRIGEGDKLFAHVYLDPTNPPRQVMFQFNSTGQGDGWKHRVFWGDNLIAFGAENTSERRFLGALPVVGQWVRLEVDAELVGLSPGMTVHGMAFTQFGGVAYYDTIGIHSATPQDPADHVWIDDEAPAGAKLQGDGAEPWNWVTGEKQKVFKGRRATRRSGQGLHQHFFTEAAAPLVIQDGDRLFAYVHLDPADPPKTIQLQFHSTAQTWAHRAYWGENLGHGKNITGPGNFRAGDLPKAGEWARLEVDARSVGLGPGMALSGWAFTQFDGTVHYDYAGVSTYNPPVEKHRHSLAEWEKVAPGDTAVPQDIRDVVAVAAASRSPEQNKRLTDYYVRYVHAPSRERFDSHNRRVALLKQKVASLEAAMPTTMISREMDSPRDAFLLIRGDFLQKGEKVQRDVPSIFPPMASDLPRNRLGLAQWLMDEKHPLTSRVAVNRLWYQMFGTGLVKSLGDFGVQGELPSHQDLLDWLATEYVRQGWSTKAVLRKIALSATYRQSASFINNTAQDDPYNRLLYRSPRFRISAEEVRDNALAAAGLLSTRIGGPSVMPYQPGDFYKGKNENWPWKAEAGENLYRRGMYTFWRRTSLHPTFAIFDAPSREECSVERPRTNTPLQALTTLNDPMFIEAARVLSQEMLAHGPKEHASRVEWMFRRVMTRPPTAAEAAALGDIYQHQHATFKLDPSAAEQLVQEGQYPRPAGLNSVDHAAWTAVANVLMNTDEAITRE